MRLKTVMAALFSQGGAAHSIWFDIHPPKIDGVFTQRLFGMGKAL